ncbi:Heterokaryon incompatibility protein 6 OR allele [Lachnellula suecica]|uniref:Heterokaryon incompatibility protein 6 OR allele n=1 Tax=Lachnellula suecica TaxID=602035 RepID=A0A8T9C127_9HELO|nr:Heterokaryon incompatibility protein 6 OR allele [Lachnellula suecica]
MDPLAYQYTKLINRDAIRLIILQPSENLLDPIRGSLIITTLSEYDTSVSDHYIAISYVWGDEGRTRSVFMDDRKLDITGTLEAALRHIRNPQKALNIWADGICINQSDVAERNSQVQLMGAIYQIARHTIIFLGEATLESTAVLNGLAATEPLYTATRGSAFISNISRMFSSESTSLDSAQDVQKSAAALDSLTMSSATRLRASAVTHILTRPWFRRVWTLQELVLSSDPWIQVGPQRMRWNVFSDSLLHAAWGSDFDGSLKLLSDMQDARSRFGASLLYSRSSAETADILLGALHARRGFGCQREVDRIYGHLGILGSNSTDRMLKATVRVDYEQEWPRLYTQVARYIITAREGLGILSHIEDIPLSGRMHLPSWVPNWNLAQVLGCIGAIGSTIEVVLNTLPPKIDLKSIHVKTKGSNNNKATLLCENVLAMFYDWLANQSPAIHTNAPIVPSTLKGSHPLYSRVLDFLFPARNGRSASVNVPIYENKPTFHLRANDFNSVGYLLRGLTDLSGPGCFPGKRIALLSNGSIALVPLHAEAGDIVCRFNLTPVPYVLRRKSSGIPANLNAEINGYFASKKLDFERKHESGLLTSGKVFNSPRRIENAEDPYSYDASTVDHFSLIGECFAEREESEAYKSSEQRFCLSSPSEAALKSTGKQMEIAQDGIIAMIKAKGSAFIPRRNVQEDVAPPRVTIIALH